jgi:hypothetical protein
VSEVIRDIGEKGIGKETRVEKYRIKYESENK